MTAPQLYYNALRQFSAVAYTDITGTPIIPAAGVTGPNSSITGDVASFADTTGQVIQDSGVALNNKNIVGSYDTRTAAASATIATSVTFVQTAGYAAVGDFGGSLYKHAGGSTTGGFQSADGQWWQLAVSTVTPQMFGAKADGSTNDQAALQNAINFMQGTYGGGPIILPPGNYRVTSTVTLKGGVLLIGSGAGDVTTEISAIVDINVINFDATCSYALLEKIFVYGYQNTGATQNVVTIADNALAIIRDCYIWGGSSGLYTAGVDGVVENSFIAGYTYNVASAGANWYIRCKFDGLPGATPTAAFVQGGYFTSGIAENHFVQCDFSGSFTYSVQINDGGTSSAITIFEGCVFSSPILIQNAKVSMFSVCEIGSTTFTVGTNSTIITGCYAFSGTTVSGAGKVLSGNVNIS